MITGMAGPGWTLEPGQVGAFDQAEATRLIEAGFAIPTTSEIERAVASPSVERRKRK